MSKAPIARQMGDDYQARFFWLEACRLFQDHTKVERVAYERNGFRAFDDVAVTYSEPIISHLDREFVTADYYQLKFHVDKTTDLGFGSFIDPSAIGATTVSLLQRLHGAVGSDAEPQARFTLVSAASINSKNTLAKIINNQDGSFRLDVLFDQTTDASEMGVVRQSWRTHLKLADNSDLYKVIKRLRIQSSFHSLEYLTSILNDRLSSVGLKPVDATRQVNPYDDLIRKLHRSGLNEFDRDSLLEICKQEGLWVGHPAKCSDRIPIGIRSFSRFTDRLEDETEQFLCLVKHFDGRRIRDYSLWANHVEADLRGFLATNVRRGRRYLFHLDTHASIALLIGSMIDTKSGIDLAVMQRGVSGSAVWESSPKRAAVPGVNEAELSANESGEEIAIALSITKEIGADAHAFASARLPSVKKVILIEPMGGPNQATVTDGAHAFSIAKQAVQIATRHRREASGIVHLFASAPNSLLLNFGRLAGVLGRIQFYEHLFGTGTPGAYEPSVMISGV